MSCAETKALSKYRGENMGSVVCREELKCVCVGGKGGVRECCVQRRKS